MLLYNRAYPSQPTSANCQFISPKEVNNSWLFFYHKMMRIKTEAQDFLELTQILY